MKFFPLFLILFIFVDFPAFLPLNTVQSVKSSSESSTFKTGTLLLQTENIHPLSGFIMVALFKGEEAFLDDQAAYKSAILEVNSSDVITEVKFSDLPYGAYTVAIFHDINGNGKMDKNFLGVPKEPYGFSNNARSKWGPPKYEVAKFAIEQPNVFMQIAVKFWSEQ